MKKHTVTAEMIDVVTGTRHFPGEEFIPHDEDQAERLCKAGCLKEGAPEKQKPAAGGKPEGDGLEAFTVARLKDLASKEGIELGDASTKDAIVAAIRAARAKSDDDGLDALEIDALTTLAGEEQIDLAGATEKDAVIAVIREARKAKG